MKKSANAQTKLFRNDGDHDLWQSTGTQDGGGNTVLLNTGTGTRQNTACELPDMFVTNLSGLDWNHDGIKDVVVDGHQYSVTSVQLWLQNPDKSRDIENLFSRLDASVTSSIGDTGGNKSPDILVHQDMILESNPDSSPWILYLCEADNEPPLFPANLTSFVENNKIYLSWGPRADDATPVEALTSNLRIGTTPYGGQVFSFMALRWKGDRLKPVPGDRGTNREIILDDLGPGKLYFWSVQCIDDAMAGPLFGQIKTFFLPSGNLAVNKSVDAVNMKNERRLVDGDWTTAATLRYPKKPRGKKSSGSGTMATATIDLIDGGQNASQNVQDLYRFQYKAEWIPNNGNQAPTVSIHTAVNQGPLQWQLIDSRTPVLNERVTIEPDEPVDARYVQLRWTWPVLQTSLDFSDGGLYDLQVFSCIKYI